MVKCISFMSKHSEYEHAAELIVQADALIIAAGSGMGVDSGLPDFRGKEGFWKAYPTLGRDQVDIIRIACPEASALNQNAHGAFTGTDSICTGQLNRMMDFRF